MKLWIVLLPILSGCATDAWRSAGNFHIKTTAGGGCSCEVSATTVTGGPSVQAARTPDGGCVCSVVPGSPIATQLSEQINKAIDLMIKQRIGGGL